MAVVFVYKRGNGPYLLLLRIAGGDASSLYLQRAHSPCAAYAVFIQEKDVSAALSKLSVTHFLALSYNYETALTSDSVYDCFSSASCR